MTFDDKNMTTEQFATEYTKCRLNPFYFIYNYVYIPITGGELKVTPELIHPKMKRVIKILHKFNRCVLMASRQLGKSTIAACMIAWAMIFFPRNKAVILNMKKVAAFQNIKTIKFIISNCPKWMVTEKPFISKTETSGHFELWNGSRVDAFYPATVHSSTTIARSLTVPILYIDEGAFIKDMGEIYGSAHQTLVKARSQAEDNNYPWFIFVTSTPNGTVGDGEWFYKRWSGAADSDQLFIESNINDHNIENWNPNIDVEKAVYNSRNTFVRVKYHWSEDPTKDENWYEEQVKELDDIRTVNQELDLIFVGSKNCIFTDDFLSSLKSVDVKHQQVFSNPVFNLDFFVNPNEIDRNDWLIISADTSQGIEASAYCAIEVFGFRDFDQIAEIQYRPGSYTDFGTSIHQVFQYFYKIMGERIILVVENNTIGQAPIEVLLHPPIADQFSYSPFLFKDRNKKGNYEDLPGVKTTGLTKPLMVGCLIEYVKDNPEGIKSRQLINQFSSIERKAGGGIKATGYSDLFMASCFAAYVRSEKALEILPLIKFSNQEIQDNFMGNIKTIAGLSDPKAGLRRPQEKFEHDEVVTPYDEAELDRIQFGLDEDTTFFPFYNE